MTIPTLFQTHGLDKVVCRSKNGETYYSARDQYNAPVALPEAATEALASALNLFLDETGVTDWFTFRGVVYLNKEQPRFTGDVGKDHGDFIPFHKHWL